MRRTKIIATLGPACASEDLILRLLTSGVDVFRMNFSHGTPADRVRLIEIIRRVSTDHGKYVPILGDIQGGSKDRKDFIDIVRITAELLGGLSALARTPELGVLMFHGPLVYLVGNYAGHTPFTEADINLFLSQYSPADGSGARLKDEFLREARLTIYPQMVPDRSDDWADRRVFVTDGNQYFNRPGPRLVESLEILAELLHPDHFHFGHRDRGWVPV